MPRAMEVILWRNVIWRLLVLLFVIVSPVCSQDSLTLDQCVVSARANGIAVKQADLALRSAKLIGQEIRTTGLPQVRFSSGASYAPSTKHFGYDPAISNMGELGGRVIVEHPLYDGGRRHLKGIESDLDISLLTNQQQLAVRDLEFEVRKTFIELLRAQTEVTLREEYSVQLSEYLDLVKRLTAGGLVAQTDLLRTQVELSSASIATSRARQLLTNAKYALSELIRTPGDTSFSASGTLELPSINVDTLISAYDSSSNLDLAVSQLNLKRAISDIREVSLENHPNLSLLADAGLMTSRENLLLPTKDRYNSLGYSVGISLDIPLIDWGGRKLRLQQRQLASETAQLEIERVSRALKTELHSAVSQLAFVRSQLDTVHSAIDMSYNSFLLTKSKYAAGEALASEVLSAQQMWSESKLSELEFLAQAHILIAQIEKMRFH